MLMKQMLYLFMTLLFQQLSHAQAKQLADLEIDGKMHQRWYLCKDMSVLLKPSEAEISDKCYKWYGKPFQGVYAFIKDSYSLNCTPNVTYFYKCERYPDETCGSGTPEAVWYYKVLVIEGIEIWYLELNDEIMIDQKSNPPIMHAALETMDEYSDYTIQGELKGVNLTDFDSKDSIVMIKYITDIGQVIPQSKSTAMTSQFIYSGKIAQVQQDGISKQYNLQIQANICNFESNVIDISVKRLWIEKFRHSKSSDLNSWNIVINDPIEFDVQATNLCSDFKWELPSGFIFPLKNNFQKSGNSIEITLDKDNMPKKNLEFGQKNGVVLVQCLYRNMAIGVYSSSDFQSNSNLNFRIMSKEMNATVFYHKDELITEDKGNAPRVPDKIPNWLYYWRQFVPRHQNIILVKYYTGQISQSAFTGRPDRKSIPNSFSFLMTTSVKQVASEKQPIRKKEGTTHGYLYGIDAFYLVLAHESFHSKFMKEEQWPQGYDETLDSDCTNHLIGDYYRDSWEDNFNDKMKYPFSSISDDYYSFEKVYNNCLNPKNKSLTVGYKYEEAMGMEEEWKASQNGKDHYKIHAQDWSYDRTNKFQGKQWK